MELYIDLCFAVNFVMDMIVFFIVSVISKSRIKKRRIVLFSLVESAIFCLFTILFGALSTVWAVSETVLNLVIVYLLFKPVSVKRYFELILISLITAFTLCGLGIWLIYFTNIIPALNMYFSKGYGIYTAVVFVFSALLAYGFIKLFSKWIDKTYTKRYDYCQIKLYYKGVCNEVTALIDNGNFISAEEGRVLVIAQTGAVYKIFAKSINIESKGDFYYMNFSSLGSERGKMKVLKADESEFIFSNDFSAKAKTDIAFYNGILSAKGGYDAIISQNDYIKIKGS